jgi:hypothetical protein
MAQKWHFNRPLIRGAKVARHEKNVLISAKNSARRGTVSNFDVLQNVEALAEKKNDFRPPDRANFPKFCHFLAQNSEKTTPLDSFWGSVLTPNFFFEKFPGVPQKTTVCDPALAGLAMTTGVSSASARRPKPNSSPVYLGRTS